MITIITSIIMNLKFVEKKCCNGASPTFCFRLWIGLFVFLGAYAPSCLVYGYNYRGNDYYILPVTYSLYIHCNVRVLKS